MKLLLVFALTFGIVYGQSGSGRHRDGDRDRGSGRHRGSGSGRRPPKPMFECWDYDWTVIPMDKVCDGIPDCPLNWNNASRDESKFECHNEDEFPCNDFTVISIDQTCDGTNDCPREEWMRDGDKAADESLWMCREEGQFICWSEQKYIDESQKCNGVVDCPCEWSTLGEDENMYQCAGPDEFVCSPEKAIPNSQRCNKDNDCAGQDEDKWYYEWILNNTTETNYTCWANINITLDVSTLNDGNMDCPGPDEDPWMCRWWNEEQARKGDNGTTVATVVAPSINEVARRRRHMNAVLDMRGVDKRHPLRYM